LDDVSETHIEAAEKEPTLEYGLALAEGLAVLHARWWGAQRLAEAGAPIHDARHIQRSVDIAQPGVSNILDHCSAELEPHWPDTIYELYAKHPQAIIKRTQDDNGFTLIHGDVGHNNILVPRDANRPIYIIDRQPFDWSLTTWLGVYDLAYAIVLDWETETRRQHELAILRRYHEHLIESGVADYSWDQLYDDYRLCVAMGVYIATEYCRGRFNERWIQVWLPILQRTLTACDDLDCSALW
jgi:thiamine kinase-like enzyme